MEHITIKDLGSDLLRLTADEGYKLFNRKAGRNYANGSVAYRKNLKDWKAIPVVVEASTEATPAPEPEVKSPTPKKSSRKK